MIKTIYKKLGKTHIEDANSVKSGIEFIQRSNSPKKFYGHGVFDVDRNVLYISALDKTHARTQIISIARILELNVNHVFEGVKIFSPFKQKN
tara:strand:- start:14946 stop:15221 length:276 start_codon:yes stop_codon:yes gene_type:complete